MKKKDIKERLDAAKVLMEGYFNEIVDLLATSYNEQLKISNSLKNDNNELKLSLQRCVVDKNNLESELLKAKEEIERLKIDGYGQCNHVM